MPKGGLVKTFAIAVTAHRPLERGTCTMFLLRSCHWLYIVLLTTVSQACTGQIMPSEPRDESASQAGLSVNWLYGAYIPRDAPLQGLNNREQAHLYVRQSFTTPGIYVKNTFISVTQQIRDRPEGWDSDFGGFVKRVGTNHADYLIQNSIRSFGDGLVGWEPRYDRCRCDGVWLRSRHAVVRNFVTYDRTESHFRPQIFLFLGAFSGSIVTATWKPDNPNVVVRGYQGAVTQIWFGSLTNLIGEFAPDVLRKFHRRRQQQSAFPAKDNRTLGAKNRSLPIVAEGPAQP